MKNAPINPVVSRPIADQIKAHRTARGMTPTEFAKTVGISRVYLYALESGKKSPSWDVVVKIWNCG